MRKRRWQSACVGVGAKEERSQGAPQSNTKCMRQGKGQVKKKSAKHENNEEAGKEEDE